MTLAAKLRSIRIRHKRYKTDQMEHLSDDSPHIRDRPIQIYIPRLESGKDSNPNLMKRITLYSIHRIEPSELFAKAGRKITERIYSCLGHQ
jgi:hypothetical protein